MSGPGSRRRWHACGGEGADGGRGSENVAVRDTVKGEPPGLLVGSSAGSRGESSRGRAGDGDALSLAAGEPRGGMDSRRKRPTCARAARARMTLPGRGCRR